MNLFGKRRQIQASDIDFCFQFGHGAKIWICKLRKECLDLFKSIKYETVSHYFSADFILPVGRAPLPNGVIAVDDAGSIEGIWADVSELSAPEQNQIRRYDGIIVPGFVNAHCHLELSHLRGMIPRKTGLVPFIQEVMDKRPANEEIVQEAMQRADREMAANGIVAVGDHVNTAASVSIKRQSELYYHTFVELLGFEPQDAAPQWARASAIRDQFEELAVSTTPHAPYSVSGELFRLNRSKNANTDNPISMHNQESASEHEFFRFKTGDFVGFYKNLDKSTAHFAPRGISSLRTIAPLLPAKQRIQLVHNTFTHRKDAHMMTRMGLNVYWCLCLQANRYIEDSVPTLAQLMDGSDFPFTIGTDSLASNDRLCIVSELKAIHREFPDLKLPDTIRWATLNGAEFLGISDRFGSIEIGKRPGINLLRNTDGLSLTENTTVEKLA